MDKRQHPRFPARFTVLYSVTVVSGEGDVVDLSLRVAAWNPRRPCILEHAHATRAYAAGRTPDHHRRSRLAVDARGPLRYRVSSPWLLKNGLACTHRDAVGTAPLPEAAD